MKNKDTVVLAAPLALLEEVVLVKTQPPTPMTTMCKKHGRVTFSFRGCLHCMDRQTLLSTKKRSGYQINAALLAMVILVVTIAILVLSITTTVHNGGSDLSVEIGEIVGAIYLTSLALSAFINHQTKKIVSINNMINSRGHSEWMI